MKLQSKVWMGIKRHFNVVVYTHNTPVGMVAASR